MTVRYKKIAGIMIAIGILFTIIGFTFGGKWYIIKDNSGFYVPNEQSLLPQSYELGSFNNIKVSNEHADIEILPSDKYALEVIAFETTDVSYVVKDNTLTIKSNNLNNEKMTIGFGPFNTPSIKIFVPKDAHLSNISIESSFGDVNFDQLNYEQLILDVLHGDISFNNSVADQTEIKNAFGDITLQHYSSGRLAIKSEHGDIDVTGELNGKTTINSSFGDVELQLLNNKSGIGYDLNTSFGDITVSDKEYGTKHSQLHDGANQLEVSLSQGDLELSFND